MTSIREERKDSTQNKTRQQQKHAVTTIPREISKQHRKWDKTEEHVDDEDGDDDRPPTLKNNRQAATRKMKMKMIPKNYRAEQQTRSMGK